MLTSFKVINFSLKEEEEKREEKLVRVELFSLKVSTVELIYPLPFIGKLRN